VAGLFYYKLHLIWLHGQQEQERRAGKTLRVSICGFEHIHKQEQGRNLERNIQSCGMQVIRRRNPPPPPPSCWESKNQQEVSMCVCELPPVTSSYRQLQICRIEHLDSKTRNKVEITHGFPLCPRTSLVQRSRLMRNEYGDEPAASYKWTGWSSRLQENYRSFYRMSGKHLNFIKKKERCEYDVTM